jgi:uncharacterized membrane protein YagU involved in acid resistance
MTIAAIVGVIAIIIGALVEWVHLIRIAPRSAKKEGSAK